MGRGEQERAMSQILNSLIVSKSLDSQHALEEIMANNLEGYVFSFATYTPEDLADIDRSPDLIFIAMDYVLPGSEIQRILRAFPRRTCVVLDENPGQKRRIYLNMGIDEVMSLSDLRSEVGKHLLEKLIAFKDLAAAEERIVQGEERFRDIIEHSHDILILLDADGTILYTSPAFTRQLGYEVWEVLGQPLVSFLHAADKVLFEHQFRDLTMVPGEDAMPMAFKFWHKNREWLDFEAIGSNLLRNVTVQSVVLHCRDVTAHRETELELEKYRRSLEELVEQRTAEAAAANRRADAIIAASPDALLAIDDKGEIMFASRHYYSLYPHSAKLLTPGVHVMDAFRVVAHETGLTEDDPRYDDLRAWWLKPEGAKEFRMQNGTWVRMQARKMRANNGIVISTTNISDYKRQQALLAQQSAELAVALAKEKVVVEQQKTFVSMVSHEFRTPLTIIDGNAQILHKRGDTIGKEAIEKRAATIRSAVERLVRLIETILSAHMMDSGRLELSPGECDLPHIVREAVADQQDISPGHKIKVEVRAGVPKVMFLDEKVIRQMMSNLLSNAVKYSPNAENVEVMVYPLGNYIVIEVQDHGIGIPDEEVSRVFTKYFRASTSSGIPGSGLGLSLVQQFVDMHRGEVTLRSKVGVGTVVTVKLPIDGQ